MNTDRYIIVSRYIGGILSDWNKSLSYSLRLQTTST